MIGYLVAGFLLIVVCGLGLWAWVADRGTRATYHLVEEGYAYIFPGRTLCCGLYIDELTDDDMIVHSIEDVPAGHMCAAWVNAY